ncbi:hypothetical protein Tco_0367930 [Tanacetum coccineum]
MLASMPNPKIIERSPKVRQSRAKAVVAKDNGVVIKQILKDMDTANDASVETCKNHVQNCTIQMANLDWTCFHKFVTANTASYFRFWSSSWYHSRNPNPEPNVAPVVAPVPNTKPSVSLPYPSRRDNEKSRNQANEQIDKFYEIFKEMSFEISFTGWYECLALATRCCINLMPFFSSGKKLSLHALIQLA